MTSPSSASTESVRVSLHALRRARERHADLRDLPEQRLQDVIQREVADAVESGRFAKNAPREAVSEPFTKRKKGRWERFCWNPARSRVYVFRRRGGVTTVVTTLQTIHSQT